MNCTRMQSALLCAGQLHHPASTGYESAWVQRHIMGALWCSVRAGRVAAASHPLYVARLMYSCLAAELHQASLALQVRAVMGGERQ